MTRLPGREESFDDISSRYWLRSETQTLRAGCSKAEPKIFAPPQTPFQGARDGQNLISWRRSLPLPTNAVWWESMHAISSYRGNRPQAHTHSPTHTHDRSYWWKQSLLLVIPRFRNDLYCVEWDIKLYRTNTTNSLNITVVTRPTITSWNWNRCAREVWQHAGFPNCENLL